MITNKNMIQEEIKRRLNSSNACYHSVQNLLSSRLLFKNIKVRIYIIIILGRACSMNGGGRGMHIGYWWESQKRPLGGTRHKWMDNIEMDLREIG
jgi:hypothetical protein